MQSFICCVAPLLTLSLMACVGPAASSGSCADPCFYDAGRDAQPPLDARVPDAPIGDANTPDAMVDAMAQVDAMTDAEVDPCGSACRGSTPACEPVSMQCVQCTAAEKSACTAQKPACEPGSHRCVECAASSDCTTAGKPACDTTSHTCVACLADADCTTPAAGRCDTTTNRCEPCTADVHCQHLTTTPACHEPTGKCTATCHGATTCANVSGASTCDVGLGLCVECSTADESDCGVTSCNPKTNTCTGTERQSVVTCGACAADSECVADHRCVPLLYQGVEHGSYCLKIASTGCAEPFGLSISRESASGAAVEAYCGIDEALTTCEAVLALTDNEKCEGGTDEECAAIGGVCRTVGTIANRCTYLCSVAADCPSSRNCSGSPKYCGGP